jgi:nitrogen regulatory protein PII
MEAVKRVEIVILSIQVKPLCRRLLALGVSGFTVIPQVEGMGNRGVRQGDEVSGVSHNSLILIACPQDKLEAILDEVRPRLKDYGGICLVSDALSLNH